VVTADDTRRAVIVTARCMADRSLFGMRMEQAARGLWMATWAFSIPPDRAAREGYTETRVDGSFGMAEGYPGCPGCANRSFAQCNLCSGLGCSTGQGYWTCPHCGVGGPLEGSITSLSSSAD
jgi:hypothetical protein